MSKSSSVGLQQKPHSYLGISPPTLQRVGCIYNVSMMVEKWSIVLRVTHGDTDAGAGLQLSKGRAWGPVTLEQMTESKPSQVFTGVTESSARQVKSQRKRKATNEGKANIDELMTQLQYTKLTAGMIMA